MAVKAGTAYVEVKYDPDSVRRLSATAKAEGEKIAHSWDDADRGLIDFDRAAQKVNKTMSGGPFGLFDTIGNVGYALLKMGGFAQDAEKSLGSVFTTASDGEGIMAGLGSTLTSLAPVAGIAATGFVALGAALLVLPALAAAVTFAFVALLDTVTILSAVVIAFLGPLAVLGGLLGGLAAGFVLGGKAALVGKHSFHDFGQTVKDLKKQFSDFGKELGHIFLPYFEQLAHAASIALTYLSRIAKLPLKQAFHSLATTGLAMLSKFLYGVANVLKKPFRLAIQVAFGAGGDNANKAIANWWDSLTKYLFGYTKTKKIHIGSAIAVDTKNIKGALQPIFDFFGRQHFVDTGLRWAHEIIDGLVRAWNQNPKLRAAVKKVLADAGHQAGIAFKKTFFAEIHAIPWRALGWYLVRKLDLANGVRTAASQAWNLFKIIAGRAWDWVKQKALSIWHSIVSAAGSAAASAGNAIKNALGNAWNWVHDKVVSVWNFITNLVQRALSVHINWPSPPSWLSKLNPFRASGGPVTAGGSYIVGEHGPETFVPRVSGMIIPHQPSTGRGGDTNVQVFIDGREIETAVVNVQRRTARTIQAGRKW